MPQAASAQSVLNVTNLSDFGPGSFRQTVTDAFPGDTIRFAVTGTIPILGTPVAYAKDLVIDGPGASLLTLDGLGVNRILYVAGGNSHISGLSFSNGYSTSLDGPGMYFVGGTLTLDSVRFSDNQIAPTTSQNIRQGAALFTSCTKVVLLNSEFISNNINCYTSSSGAGKGLGAGVGCNADSLVVRNSTFEENYLRCRTVTSNISATTRGGAIAFAGKYACIETSHFDSNYVSVRAGFSNLQFGNAFAQGGAVYINQSGFDGEFIFKGCSFQDNSGDAFGNNYYIEGGAVFAEGNSISTHFSNCTFEDNIAGIPVSSNSSKQNYFGGALYLSALGSGQDSAAIDACTFIGNSTRRGGAIYTNELEFIQVENSDFNGNHGTLGGAINHPSGDFILRQSRFENNFIQLIGSSGSGGALFTQGTNFTASGNLFINNLANSSSGSQRGLGGAIYTSNSTSNNIFNNTFANNVSYEGGGIYTATSLVLTNNTFVDDASLTSNAGTSLHNAGGTTILKNNIFSNTVNDPDPYVAGPGSVVSLGGNLARDNSVTGILTHPTDLNQSNPALQPLSNNGGLTETYALGSNSPAINSAVADGAIAMDQRGWIRDSLIDRGAYEFGGIDPELVTISMQPSNQAACEGDTSVFSIVASSTSLSYQWFVSSNGGATFSPLANTAPYNGVNSSVLDISPLTTSLDANQYFCAINGTDSSDVVILTVSGLPTANAGVDQTICAGQTANLVASGGMAYNWDQGLGTGQNQTVSPGNSTSYAVTVTNSGGCTDTDQMTVTVNPMPTANAGMDQTICEGQSANLNATGGNAYTWNQGLGAGQNQSVSPLATTSYAVTVTDASGCTDTDQLTITVNPLPIAEAGTDQTICEGQTAALGATGGVSYSWDQGLGAGQNQTVSPSNTTIYTVTATDANGCTDTDQVTVNVNALPMADAGMDQAICEGQSASLSATGGASYTWNQGLGAGQSQIVTPTSTTSYNVTVTSTNGCTASDQVMVTVNALPTANAGMDQTICEGQTASLSAAGGNAYTWNQGLGAGQNQSVSPLATTSYAVTVTDASGCTDTDQLTITVNPLPTAEAGTDQTICEGQTAALGATGGVSYSWDQGLGAGQNQSVSPSNTTVYTVTATDANGCTDTDQVTVNVNALPIADAGMDQAICEGQSASLSATGGASYTWNQGLGAGQSQIVTPTSTTSYNVTVTSTNGCTASDQVMVTVNALPTANAGMDQTICEGQSANLNATGGNAYTWNQGLGAGQNQSVSPLATTSYAVTVTDANGCTDTDQLTITVNPLPTAEAGTDQTICEGQTAALGATGGVSYSWDQGLGAGQNQTVSPSNTTIYTVTATDANGCTDTDQVTVNVNALPMADAGMDQAICEGQSASLSATGGTSYTWDQGLGAGQAHPVSPSATTTYTVTVSNADGCTADDQITISVNAMPTASAGSNQTICAGNAVTLNASGGTSYTWDQGLGMGQSQTVSPSSTTTYTVTASNPAGCSDTAQATVFVNALPVVTFLGLDSAYCSTAALDSLIGDPGNGSFSGPGINGSTFDPVTAGVGTHSISYSYTDSNGCQNSSFQTVVVDVCMGTEHASQLDVKLFPNPSSGKSTLVLPDVFIGQPMELKVYDQIGKQVYQVKWNLLSTAQLPLNFEEISAGNYILQLQIGNGIPLNKRLVIRK